MPGKHVTEKKLRHFMRNVYKHGVVTAAMKAGFSRNTGYRIMSRGGTIPVAKPRGSRRPDPLVGIFDVEVVPLLENDPEIRPVAVFDMLMDEHPELSPGIRRTLERRIREWKAVNGPVKKTMYRPRYRKPEVTHMKSPGVSIGG